MTDMFDSQKADFSRLSGGGHCLGPSVPPSGLGTCCMLTAGSMSGLWLKPQGRISWGMCRVLSPCPCPTALVGERPGTWLKLAPSCLPSGPWACTRQRHCPGQQS